MSSITSNLTRLSDFNAESVIDQLFINRNDEIMVAAVRAIFRHISEWDFHPNRLLNNTHTIDLTLEMLGSRFELLDSYKFEFMKGFPCHHEALKLAVAFNVVFSDIDPAGTSSDRIPPVKDIDGDLMQRAWKICAEAGKLKESENSCHEISREALFLAHINALDEIDDFIQDAKDYEESELKEIPELLAAARSIMQPKQKISERLGNFIAKAEEILPDYEGKRICRNLNLRPDQIIEKTSIRFVLNQTMEEYEDQDILDAWDDAEERVTSRLGYRLHLFNTYAANFFGGSNFEQEPLLTAILTGSHIGNANASANRNEWKFELVDLCAALLISNQGEELILGQCGHGKDIEHEAIFYAHVMTLCGLEKTLDNFEDLDISSLKDIKSLVHIDGFLCRESEIGKKIISLMDQLSEKIGPRSETAQIIPFRQAQSVPSPAGMG